MLEDGQKYLIGTVKLQEVTHQYEIVTIPRTILIVLSA